MWSLGYSLSLAIYIDLAILLEMTKKDDDKVSEGMHDKILILDFLSKEARAERQGQRGKGKRALWYRRMCTGAEVR